MNDYSDLKKLADAATPGEWKFGFNPNCVEDSPDILFKAKDSKWYSLTEIFEDRDIEYIAAANPERIKQLILELENKSKEIGRSEHRGNTVDYIYDKVATYGHQIDELVKERDELKKSLENALGYKAHHDNIFSRSVVINTDEYDKQVKERGELERKLDIAVKALDSLLEENACYTVSGYIADEALAKINDKGDKE